MTDEDHDPDSSDAMLRNMLGYAWLALTFSLALHVIDEADHDFVAVYRPIVALAHNYTPFLPVPDFPFAGWLVGLALIVFALLSLSPLAFCGGRWIRGASYVLAALMAINALEHCLGTLHSNRPEPGTWSALLLMVAAAWLFVAARRTTPGHHFPLSP